uniref:Uncharacterized protein n=1 Tax=Alexandrium monilatum TaxID=311494 RepID=A0A7S4PU18_9DINO
MYDEPCHRRDPPSGSTDASARPSAERYGTRLMEMSSLPLLEMKLEARLSAVEAALDRRCGALENKVSLLARTAVRDTASMQKQLQELAKQVEATAFLLQASRDMEANKQGGNDEILNSELFGQGGEFGESRHTAGEVFPREDMDEMWQQLKAWCDQRYQTIPKQDAVDHEQPLASLSGLATPVGSREHLAAIQETDLCSGSFSSEDRQPFPALSSTTSLADLALSAARPPEPPEGAHSRTSENGVSRSFSSPSTSTKTSLCRSANSSTQGGRPPSPMPGAGQACPRSSSPTQTGAQQQQGSTCSSPQVSRRSSTQAPMGCQSAHLRDPRGSPPVPLAHSVGQQSPLASRTPTPGAATPARCPTALGSRGLLAPALARSSAQSGQHHRTGGPA